MSHKPTVIKRPEGLAEFLKENLGSTEEVDAVPQQAEAEPTPPPAADDAPDHDPVEPDNQPAEVEEAEEPVQRERGDDGRFKRRDESPKQEQGSEVADPSVGELTLTYRGKQVTMSTEKVIKLAQQGFDYSQKMEALNAQKQGMEAYTAFQDHMQKNPEVAEVIQGVLDHHADTGSLPRLVTHDGQLDAGDREVLGTSSTKEAARLDRLERFEMERQEAAQAERLVARIEQTISSHPELAKISGAELKRTGGKSDLVFEKLSEAVKADPTADIDVLADMVATDIRRVRETLGGDEYARAADARSKRYPKPVSGGGGQASTPKPKPLTGEDLRRGNVRRAVSEAFGSLLGS